MHMQLKAAIFTPISIRKTQVNQTKHKIKLKLAAHFNKVHKPIRKGLQTARL